MNTPVIDNKTKEIPSLLIPMQSHQLLLPTVSVAEMIPYREPQSDPLSENHSWYLGRLSWRGINVPMISIEGINGQAIAEPKGTSQVAILNTTGNDMRLPFLAIPTQGIPHLCRVVRDEISEDLQTPLGNFEEMHVYVAGEQAVIPDINQIEITCLSYIEA